MGNMLDVEDRIRYAKAISLLRKIAIKSGWVPLKNPFDIPTPTGEIPSEWWNGLSREEQTLFLNQ